MKPSDISLVQVLGTPAVSPGGRHAVVAVTRPDLEADAYRGGLWLVPTDGSERARRLTHGPPDSAPVYSPDGMWLAFVRSGPGVKARLGLPLDLYGEPSTWADQSPLTHAGRITLPMLIIHSEHDWRAPVEQAQRLFVELKLPGVETGMLLFPDEGHEMSRSGLPSRRIARFDAILDWWQRHL